ncbi:MAG: hypothetical protein RLZ98_1378 [Pseudomonadota bacterium]
MNQHEKITSLQNARIKAIRALEMRKARRETGQFVAEGASLLIAAREAGHVPETVVYLADQEPMAIVSEFLAWADEQGAQCMPASHAVLAKLSGKDNPQTLLAVYRQRWRDLPAAGGIGQDQMWLALEEVRDPGNLGTIIRTMDAVGGAGVILIGNCCDAYARECVRATMGSVFSVPLVRVTLDRFAAWRQGFRGDVVGTHLAACEDFREAEYCRPTVLLMGSEGPGLSQRAEALCTRLVKIPMSGRLDSLNLAVATALTLYQIQGPRLRL